ncbi:ribokinase-like isoform X1 [Agrilus planipennis]|uniref:Ribokinase n=1 Tax=Agrilus planipennis TaxID=224129 RepID=A0A1W4WPY4_AGRPL|nr:ribokinase-like isoform X1 [Agrilus planipennis]
MEVVAVGGCWCDFVSISPKLPKKGQTILGSKFLTQHGGKAANVAVTVSHLKGKSAIIGRVGNDFWGENRIKSLNELGVNTNCLQKTSGHHTGIAMVNLSEAGENQIVGIPGANYQVSAQDIDKYKSIIEKAEVVVVTLEIPVPSAIRSLELSQRISILNAAPARKNCDPALFTLPTVFVVNETEASMFTGLPVVTLEDGKKAVKCFLEKGCKSVIITMGERGVVFGSKASSDPVHVKCRKVACIDSTAAGDAFVGVLAYLMSYRKDIEMEQMVEAACYCASYSVTIQGSQASLPTLTTLQQYFLDKF